MMLGLISNVRDCRINAGNADAERAVALLRKCFMNPDLRDRLWPYLGGITRENKMKAMAIGGTAHHVHMLISLPLTLSVSKAVQLLKGNSSKWHLTQVRVFSCTRHNG